jgi:hypothetical protein
MIRAYRSCARRESQSEIPPGAFVFRRAMAAPQSQPQPKPDNAAAPASAPGSAGPDRGDVLHCKRCGAPLVQLSALPVEHVPQSGQAAPRGLSLFQGQVQAYVFSVTCLACGAVRWFPARPGSLDRPRIARQRGSC